MTLAEFQPHVERAIAVVANATAKARILAALEDERTSIQNAIRFVEETEVCPHCGERHCVHIQSIEDQREPLLERAAQLATDIRTVRQLDQVPEDQIPELPLLSVPMDLITEAVVRRVMGLPSGFPILRINKMPQEADIERAVSDLSQKWRTSRGQSGPEKTHVVNG